ncbi:MAG TPA: hypothetical protein VIV12_22255, partial [Streptosporangiaceae bacterium]
MKVLGSASIPVPASAGTKAGLAKADAQELPGLAAGRQAGLPRAREESAFGRVARLAAMVLGTPQAYV